MPTTVVRSVSYTTRLQKGGALIPEMRQLVREWSEAEGTSDRIVAANRLTSPSRARGRDVVARTFVPRFVRSNPPNLWHPLAVLEQARWPTSALIPLHYYAAAAAEPILWDFVTDVLADKFLHGQVDVTVAEAERFLSAAPASRFHDGRWSATVTTKVARGLLAALRDFGVLAGAAKKRVAPLYLPTESFAFIAMIRHHLGIRGSALLHDDVWRLFFLSDLAVERFFMEAHQRKLLSYEAAGSLVNLSFRSHTLDEYACELAEIAR